MTNEEFKSSVLPLKNSLYRYAFYMIGNEADAKDVVQDVMMKAWETITDLDSIRNIEAWCMTVVKNTVFNKLKKKGRVYNEISEELSIVSTVKDPHVMTELDDEMGRITKILSTFPDNKREVIQLRDIEGRTYKEISQIMGLELSHVKILLFRARKSIRELLIKADNHGVNHA